MDAGNELLVGTWRLTSCFMEDVETKEKKPAWGEHPNGYLILTAAGRWMVIQTAEGREAPRTEGDLGLAFRSMLAYSGRYRPSMGRSRLLSIFRETKPGPARTRSGTSNSRRIGCKLEAPPQR
jgi:hypothetical protein